MTHRRHPLRILTAVVPAVLPLLIAGASEARRPEPGRQPPAQNPCATTLAVGDVGLAVGGQVRLMANQANFGFHQTAVEPDRGTGSFANARFRSWVNVHDRQDCRYGAYVQFEVGHIGLGEEFEFTKTSGTELRRGFLWFKPTEDTLVRAGVLDWHDRFGGRPTFAEPQWSLDRSDAGAAPLASSMWGFQVGGVVLEGAARDRWHYSVGTLLLQQGDQTVAGDGGALLFSADVDVDIGSGLWGASVYFLRDRGGYSYGEFGGPMPGTLARDSWDLWVGARGHFSTGRASSSVFLIVNTGKVEAPQWEHAGWAAKAATAIPFGDGSLRFQALLSTGDDGRTPGKSGEFRTIAQSVRDNAGAQSYWSPLGLTAPRGPSDVDDLGLSLQNRGRGLVTVQAEWSQPVARDWSTSLAAGWLRSSEPNPASGSSAIGTELLAELRWQMARLLALEFGGGVLVAGDFLAPDPQTSPGTLYEFYSRWQLAF